MMPFECCETITCDDFYAAWIDRWQPATQPLFHSLGIVLHSVNLQFLKLLVHCFQIDVALDG